MQRIIKLLIVLTTSIFCIVLGEWSEYSIFPTKDNLALLYNFNVERDTLFKPITIINYRYDDEHAILNAIEYSDLLGAKVIGIDIMLSEKPKETLYTRSPLVYPLIVQGDSVVKSVAIANSRKVNSFGNVIPSSQVSFKPIKKSSNDVEIESFSLLIVKYYNLFIYENYLASSNSKQYIKNIPILEIVNYIDDFTMLSIEDGEKLIRDKIVLIGFLGNEETQNEDLHSTIIGKKYGVELLAYEIYTLLTGGVKSISWWYYIILYSFLLSLIFLLEKSIKRTGLSYLLLKVFQAILYIVVEFLSYMLAQKLGLLLSTNGSRLLIIILPEVLFWLKRK